MRKIKIALLLGTCLLLTQCGVRDWVDRLFSDTTTQAVNVIDNAIADLSFESANWRDIMQKAIADLPSDIQSTIRTEMSDLLNRAVAATGAEIRCNTDFLRNRLAQGLQNIKANLLNQEPPQLEPQLCNIIPLAVDMGLSPDRRNKIEFYGYDFDKANIVALLENDNGTVDVSNSLDRPTHYHMTLNLGGTGVNLNPRSQRLILRWNDRVISTIGIIQASPDICATRTVNVLPNPVSYTPPHTRGDRDFDGNGPDVTSRVRLINKRNSVDAEIFLEAKETKSDWTTASGTRTVTLFTPDSGWEIENIVGPTESSYAYRDNDHSLDRFPGTGPVRTYTFMGDGPGDDAGVHTRVEVTFNRIRLELKEIGDCISETAIRSAVENKMISTESLMEIQELKPSIQLQPK